MAPETVHRKSPRSAKTEGKRQQVVDFLRSMGIIGADFTGDLVLRFNRGGLTSSERLEKNVID